MRKPTQYVNIAWVFFCLKFSNYFIVGVGRIFLTLVNIYLNLKYNKEVM
ncbi:hypothetical protein MTCD1_01813 [Colwellia marinimaniae]|uniref:Uncharacterized protein n=1 Tax=Colwellia marinimaniae TaxID=1513592 RepID=A0ABQ0MV14_9GAMM|nr:hypothetical protein MTCD1_01813 [Colwellia marinimaniae]